MKMTAIILTAVIFMMSFAVCSAEKISPDASMKKTCNAFLYVDENDLKDFNTSPEKFREMYAGFFRNATGGIKFTDEQSNRMADALIEQMRNKIKFAVETESADENKAVVAVTVTGINFNETLSNLHFTYDTEKITDEQLSEMATTEIIKQIKTVHNTPTETVKFNCNFDEETNLWIPEGNSENNLSPLFDAALK